MRIVHVVRQFYPAVGGVESVVWELATRQARDAHMVRVVTLDRLFKTDKLGKRPAHELVSGIEIVRIPFFGSSRYPIAPSILSHVGDADIVHVHAIDFFFDYLAWTRLLHQKKLVVSTHGGFFHTSFAARLKEIYFSTVTRGSMREYDGVVAVSQTDRDRFSRIRARGLVCIENGVDIQKFDDASSHRAVKSMIWIGRFSQNKRLDRLIHFFASLSRLVPDWRLTIAGRPWDLDLKQVQELVDVSGVRNSVTIEEAPDDARIRRLIGSCSVIVSSSDYEGFGIAAIEGMSAGLFPLLSDIPPFERLVAASGVGLNVNFADPEAAAASFAERWQNVAANYSSIRQRSIAAAARYGWENVVNLYRSLYDDVLGARYRTILDVPVFAGTRDEAVQQIDAAYASGKPTIVVFANANTLNVASRDERYRSVLKHCLVMNDGIGIDTASRILFGSHFPQNLNGTDFTPDYLKQTKNSHRIFFLGASSGVAERAASRLITMCGGRHRIAGYQNGYLREGDAMTIVAKIVASKADVLLVAMGNPLQELWLAEHLQATGCRLGIGVGALFDFLSGDVARAPLWVREARLEWVYRLLLEPGRLWHRYLVGNPVFLMRVLGQWWSGARV
ncbi:MULTISPECIES: WecB/TagA/CpsF family glycosyltransferase [unclassified Bradyrhizobium]|uniref:WecB/TagA/CpsF family glycosyltransferase n=1 Tax=unclassified Bradyrhizobium TaxID=2631580 RepID=UPI00247A944F|nr:MULTISPECIES: WecB/TagA/CpsF family glycosyltransferase [unclassified Bradyrhizobium]WGR68657.1 WecB/TagA/CpsF family glycosyltransferase [Bradyrhizobium sp. ISRA426]WGR80712.1 WecB/TagA/CpsF family glycosyltransferase [Bradyrhizobium sp. ISRA430]WGR83897.1 WecB/TagA/CpsF family glycosyltransferase [Bradyrhizobium sp. ISRA432]